ncbi:hypothetical protein DL768_010289 [Monosporascus sp. mg162]|nr:hypothetical protein DL768_010289 [Monosporascus sp. mg162]
MEKLLAAVAVLGPLVAGAVGVAITVPRASSIQINGPLTPRSDGDYQAPGLKWRQILGTAIGCVVWLVVWAIGMRWLLRRNRRQRAEIREIKAQLESEHPGRLSYAGITPTSSDEEEKDSLVGRMLCPCLPMRSNPPAPPTQPERTTAVPEPDPPNQRVGPPSNGPVMSERQQKTLETPPKPVEPATTPGTAARRTLQGHNGRVRSVAFSHDSRLLASASNDGTIKLWDLMTDQCLQTLEGHGGWVGSVAFLHDSKMLVSGSEDGVVRLWDIDTAAEKCWKMLRGHGGGIWSVSVSHNSELIASASSDSHVKVWETQTATGRCRRTLRTSGKEAWSVAFSHDSQLLASTSSDGTIEFWDPKTGVRRQRDGIYDSSNPSASFLHGLRTDQSTPDDHGHTRPANMWLVAFSSDLHLTASAPGNDTVELWDLRSGECVRKFGGGGRPICSLALSRDSKLLATGSEDGTVKLWKTETSECLQTLEGHGGWVGSIAFSHDSKLLAAGSEDGTVRLWGTVDI